MEKINITNVRKTFRTPSGNVSAVDNITTTIPAGQILAILGPNGAGKTTLLDIILGLSKPSSGTITIDGLSPHDAIHAGNTSALLQTGGLLATMSVTETLTYIAASYRPAKNITRERIADVVAQTQLGPLLNRKIGKLSGGEQQRVKFALALLPDPSLLILDEPTTGMDVNARHEFWDAMHAQTRHGRTIIFATHYLQEAEDFADRIILMNRGRIIADGPTNHIRAIAGIRHVTATTGDVSPAQVARIQTTYNATVEDTTLTCATSHSDDLARELLKAGASNLEIVPSSLDDAFATLIAADTLPKED
ncbi:ABC transporter ATP-binding protein [Arcanobacterium buesumense]|uniref:ABC transporter ATP-binding protein n=1 Tax=Arcanobacterium buesumense TaxID=2722751 RepID=A0A6H2EMX3_9ACTO|nr:ABC transporter ATP-binding protein [Arcanobacterium buesumense]QJC22428.1 ABC transporter ATP-binding protein [Arcanobacterium buesumense]